MRVRDHIAFSTAAAALSFPWLGRGVVGLWAGGVLIDGDHYAWFCARQRRLGPMAAMRYFNEPHAAQCSETRLLHSRVALAAAFLLALHHRPLMTIAIGMGMHVALDNYYAAHMAEARAAALRRDNFSCRACGTRTRHIATHLWQQPRLLPSYRTDNLISLCDPCHEAAHFDGDGATSWS